MSRALLESNDAAGHFGELLVVMAAGALQPAIRFLLPDSQVTHQDALRALDQFPRLKSALQVTDLGAEHLQVEKSRASGRDRGRRR